MDDVFLARVQKDYPEYAFRVGKKFTFCPPKTIVFNLEEDHGSLLLLHELGHAICKHRDFYTDAQRLKMERAAWNKAKELAEKYGVLYDTELVEDELDTYRCWLDTKSRCPVCKLTRYQTPDGKYHCPRCESIITDIDN